MLTQRVRNSWLQVNVKRDKALEILSKEGMLLVLCSLIDNMPYVVAEAAVRSSLSLLPFALELPEITF